MNYIRSAIVSAIFSATLAGPAVQAQTAEEIVAKHIAAMGGAEKLQSINSLYIEATAVTGNGMEISTKTWKVKDKLYRQEINFGMGSVTMIATPTNGWASDPRSGGEFKAIPADRLKIMQSLINPAPLADYAAKGGKVELAGKDTVAGKECLKVHYTGGGGDEAWYSFDPQTYYVLRESRKGGGMMGGGGRMGAPGGGGQGGNGGGGQGGNGGPGGRRGMSPDGTVSIDYADYEKTPEGYIFPNTIIAGGFGVKSSVEKIEVNKDVDVATLSKPGK